MSKNRFSTLLPIAALCALIANASHAGSATGRILFEGKAPKLELINMGADPNCVSQHSSPVSGGQLVLGDGNTLGNVFVRIKNPPAGGTRPSTSVVIDQNGCLYQPRVVGVMVGQPLEFKNSDTMQHSVHGMPKVNSGFNIGMPPTVRKSVTFSQPEGPFPVQCDDHPWMTAYVAVMTHPFFAVTGRDGRFAIDGLPDGTYELQAWHETLGAQTGEVTVSGGTGSVRLTFRGRK